MAKKQTKPKAPAKPRQPRKKADPKPVSKQLSDEAFFNEYLKNWLAPNAPLRNDYFNLHRQTAKLLADKYQPKTCIDLGCGPGVFVREMNILGVSAVGAEKNPHFQEWHNAQGWEPYTFLLDDFANSEDPDGVWHPMIKHDIVTCIEVMEHITDEDLHPVLDDIAANCKLFVFSSTPHRSDKDEEWGHINIKQKEEWKAMFKEHGLTWVEDLNLPTNWTMVFKSTKQ